MRADTGILLVGRADDWQQGLRDQLASAAVRWVETGTEALRECAESPPDLVILAMMLPDMTGLGSADASGRTCSRVAVPIIISSAQASEIDRVLAFECGADDFVPLPISGLELAAAPRRSSGEPLAAPADSPPQRRQRFGHVVFDPDRQRVEVDGGLVRLTATEFRVLSLLATGPGKW